MHHLFGSLGRSLAKRLRRSKVTVFPWHNLETLSGSLEPFLPGQFSCLFWVRSAFISPEEVFWSSPEGSSSAQLTPGLVDVVEPSLKL